MRVWFRERYLTSSDEADEEPVDNVAGSLTTMATTADNRIAVPDNGHNGVLTGNEVATF